MLDGTRKMQISSKYTGHALMMDMFVACCKQALKTIAVKKGTPSKELMGISWKRVLQMEFEKVYFKKLLQFMESEKKLNRKVYPPIQDVYSWSDYCAFEDVKVVILGQDPYHGPGQAHGMWEQVNSDFVIVIVPVLLANQNSRIHFVDMRRGTRSGCLFLRCDASGLAFSVRKGQRIPPSLLNMYKELETDIDGFVRPKHGYLASWASQGVLMLNAALTVLEGSPKSHAGKGWEQLTQAIVDALNARRSNLVSIFHTNKPRGIAIQNTEDRFLFKFILRSHVCFTIG